MSRAPGQRIAAGKKGPGGGGGTAASGAAKKPRQNFVRIDKKVRRDVTQSFRMEFREGGKSHESPKVCIAGDLIVGKPSANVRVGGVTDN